MTAKRKVPKLRFPEFAGEWEERKLGDITKWASGGTPSKDRDDYWDGEIPWISASSMKGNEFGDSNLKISKKGLEKGSKLAKRGSILILVRGSMLFNTIPVGITTRDVAFNQDVKSIDVFDGNEVKYLLYWLIASESKLLNMVTGTGIGAGKLDLLDLKKLAVFVPTLPEQQKIATFLTTIDTRIQQLSRKKALLEQYKKGVMQQLFSQEIRFKDEGGKEFPAWEEKVFSKILIENRLGGNYSNTEKKTDCPLIKMGNLDRGNIVLGKLEYISDGEKIDPKDRVNYGDLFLNTRNTLDLVGKVAIWKNELPLAYYNSNLMYIKFENNFFMNYKLNSFEGLKKLRRIATGTTSVAAIYSKDLFKLKFFIPSLPEQQKIAAFLSTLDRQINLVSQQLERMQTFKKGLLQQMFV